MPEFILDWGISLILLLVGLGDWLILPMNIFTFTGNIEFYLLILPGLYWCLDHRLGLRVAIIFLLGTSFNLILKMAIHDPRPYWADTRVRLLTGAENSFGLPSAHAQNSVVIWGMVAAYFKTGWGWFAAILLMLFIGLSRMYLGVHYPTDVFVGWTIGLIGLLLFMKLEKPVGIQFSRLKELVGVSTILAISIGLVLMAILIANTVNMSWQLPAEWVENAAVHTPDEPITPFSLEDTINTAATFFGLVSGAILYNHRFQYQAGGSWRQRLGRYLVGVVGVIILWRGLGGLFALIVIDESLAGYVLRYIRYSLIGVWVSAAGPMLFVRLSLAEGHPTAQS